MILPVYEITIIIALLLAVQAIKHIKMKQDLVISFSLDEGVTEILKECLLNTFKIVDLKHFHFSTAAQTHTYLPV